MTEEQFDGLPDAPLELHSRNAAKHRREIVARAQARALPLASHDDATRAHVAEAVEHGMTIAEFPTTREAAEASRDARAGRAGRRAQPACWAARTPATSPPSTCCATGQADILSSDYVPASLMERPLQAARGRHRHLAARRPVRLASLNPAERRRPRRSRRDRRRPARRPGARAPPRRGADGPRRLARRRAGGLAHAHALPDREPPARS